MNEKTAEQLSSFQDLNDQIEKIASAPLSGVKTAADELSKVVDLKTTCATDIEQIDGELVALKPVRGADAGKLFLTKRRALEANLAARKADLDDITSTLLPLNEAELKAAKESLRGPVQNVLSTESKKRQKIIDNKLQEIDALYHEWLRDCFRISNIPELKGVLGVDELSRIATLRTRLIHEARRMDIGHDSLLKGTPGNFSALL